MKFTSRRRLDRLLTRARLTAAVSEPVSDAGAPFGLATRVAARWAAGEGETSVLRLWDRAAGWGTVAASAICLTALLVMRFEPRPASVFDDFLNGAASESAGGDRANE